MSDNITRGAGSDFRIRRSPSLIRAPGSTRTRDPEGRKHLAGAEQAAGQAHLRHGRRGAEDPDAEGTDERASGPGEPHPPVDPAELSAARELAPAPDAQEPSGPAAASRDRLRHARRTRTGSRSPSTSTRRPELSELRYAFDELQLDEVGHRCRRTRGPSSTRTTPRSATTSSPTPTMFKDIEEVDGLKNFVFTDPKGAAKLVEYAAVARP